MLSDKIFAVASMLACGLSLGIEIARAQDHQSLDQTITNLIGANEFKSEEIELLNALPISSVPLLTQTLRNVPAGTNHLREFTLLASKVDQFERQLTQPVLDNAVVALLERLQPEDHDTSSLKVTLRIKLNPIAFIEHPRIVDGVRKARVFLGVEQETAGEIPQRALHQSAAEVSEMEKSGKRQMQTTPGKAGQTASTLWPAWVAMALGSLGLLWMFLKPKAASERGGHST